MLLWHGGCTSAVCDHVIGSNSCGIGVIGSTCIGGHLTSWLGLVLASTLGFLGLSTGLLLASVIVLQLGVLVEFLLSAALVVAGAPFAFALTISLAFRVARLQLLGWALAPVLVLLRRAVSSFNLEGEECGRDDEGCESLNMLSV